MRTATIEPDHERDGLIERDVAHDTAVHELAVREVANTAAARAIKVTPTRVYGFDEMVQMANAFAASGLFRDVRDKNGALAKILAGADLGFSPMQSMTQIMIVDGKPTLSAPSVGALVKRSQRYDYRVTSIDDSHCTLQFLEWKEPVGESTFTLSDAAKAGLANKDVWKKYPRNMCFSRAMTNGARWYAAEAFNGAIYTPEELGADVELTADGDMIVVSTPPHNAQTALRVADGAPTLPQAIVEAMPPVKPEPEIEPAPVTAPARPAAPPTAAEKSGNASKRNAYIARLNALETQLQLTDEQKATLLDVRYAAKTKNELTRDQMIDYGKFLAESVVEMKAYYENLAREQAEKHAAEKSAAAGADYDDDDYPDDEA